MGPGFLGGRPGAVNRLTRGLRALPPQPLEPAPRSNVTSSGQPDACGGRRGAVIVIVNHAGERAVRDGRVGSRLGDVTALPGPSSSLAVVTCSRPICGRGTVAAKGCGFQP